MFKLSKKQTLAWKRLEDNKTTEVLYGGAAGGGKSLLGCVWHIYRRTTYPGTRGLIGRSVLKNLKDSTLVTFFDACKKMGYTQGVDFAYNSQSSIIKWQNGSSTILKDLYLYPSDPDFASLGSTEFTDVFVDEATEITLKAYDILRSRIRYKLNENSLIPKMYLTGNPAPGWVKSRFVQDDEGKPINLADTQSFIRANVFDNPDKEFVKFYSQQLSEMSSDYDKDRLLHGDWDVEREIERPFAHYYDEAKHVAPTVFNPNTKTLVLIDFNIDPFCANVFNIWNDGTPHVHQVDEIELQRGTIAGMAQAIKVILGPALYTCEIGGDYNGNNNRLGSRDNKSMFKELQQELGISERQFKLVSNPFHKTSREDVNYFLKHFPDFKIGEQCKGTRRDMRKVQVDLYGSIIKRNRKDESQRADFIDNVRYLVNTFFKRQIEHHRKSGVWK